MVLDVLFTPLAYSQEADNVCFGMEDCIQALRSEKPKIYSGRFRVYRDYFIKYPKESQQFLVPLLKDNDKYVVKSAINILDRLDKISPVYTQDLIQAHKAGYNSLEDLIASTESQEALDYLWQGFLDDPEQSVDHFEPFDQRMDPLIEEAKTSCIRRQRLTLCLGVAEIIESVRKDAAGAENYIIDLATTDSIPMNLKIEARFDLMSDGHELARNFYESTINWLLADFRGPRNWADFFNGHEWTYDYDVSYLVEVMLENGFDTQQIGPIVMPILAYPELKKSRRAVAQAIVETRYRPGAKALLSHHDSFEDDWILAYHAIEAFGRLGVKEAEPVLNNLRDNHWYNPVRRHAKRALNAIQGGKFEIETDRIRKKREQIYLAESSKDDEIIVTTHHGPRSPVEETDVFDSCETAITLPYIEGLYAPPIPNDLKEIIALKAVSIIGIEEFNQVLLEIIGASETNAPSFLLDIDGQVIFSDGLDRETGQRGGLYLFDDQNLSTKLIEGNYRFGFPTKNGLILISEEINYDAVHLYTREDGRYVFKREVFLPFRWDDTFYGPNQSLIFSTRWGDLGVDKNGSPFDPVVEGFCAGPEQID